MDSVAEDGRQGPAGALSVTSMLAERWGLGRAGVSDGRAGGRTPGITSSNRPLHSWETGPAGHTPASHSGRAGPSSSPPRRQATGQKCGGGTDVCSPGCSALRLGRCSPRASNVPSTCEPARATWSVGSSELEETLQGPWPPQPPPCARAPRVSMQRPRGFRDSCGAGLPRLRRPATLGVRLTGYGWWDGPVAIGRPRGRRLHAGAPSRPSVTSHAACSLHVLLSGARSLFFTVLGCE